ncbi:hypothetical protein N7449_007217 [Penicillium cf. viridicatum]|uniref:Uncharacterized protein n=1 Tax=Penicillium cf. viridicatum TaxID=2972119 RepID=A0A9W9JGY2_9EURO|nr:hypothetical protein N7449_007217 [Penicillium cf. viridicatum]
MSMYAGAFAADILDLQKLAFEKVTTRFADLEELDSLDTRLAMIASSRLSFRKPSTQDPLLDRLAQYAAYCDGKFGCSEIS